MEDFNTLYNERTKEILNHQELIDAVNKRKRINNKVTKEGLNKSICFDGILNRGKIEYNKKDKYWTCESCGEEIEKWSNSKLRILCITKDSNENVSENTESDDAGWDIRCESGRNNESNDINITATFYKNYMEIVAFVFLCFQNTLSQNELLEANNAELFRCIWEQIPLARINLKKQPGCGSISNSLLASYTTLYKDVLQQQIKSLKANVIICTSVVGLELLKQIYKLERVNAEHLGGKRDWVYVDKINKITVINSYHFSYWARWVEKFRKSFYLYYTSYRDMYGMVERNTT